MDHVSNRADLDALRAEIHRIEQEPSFDFGQHPQERLTSSLAKDEPAPLPDEKPPVVGQFDEAVVEEAPLDDYGRRPFGAWLLDQAKRKDWISELAKWAKSDIRFPKNGDVEDVRKRLTEINAEGDAFEALDDAELDWLAM